MKSQRMVRPVDLEQRFASRHLLEYLSRNIFSFQQLANMRFVEGRIVEQCEEHIHRGMMQENGKFFASGDERAFAFIRDHFRSPQRAERQSILPRVLRRFLPPPPLSPPPPPPPPLCPTLTRT